MTHILELLDVEQELRRDSRPTRQQKLLLLPFHPVQSITVYCLAVR